MKRNKITVLAPVQLNPLTKRILAQMGTQGQAIQSRLKIFHRLKSSHPEKLWRIMTGVIRAVKMAPLANVL
jgi:hypothetical protein